MAMPPWIFPRYFPAAIRLAAVPSQALGARQESGDRLGGSAEIWGFHAPRCG